MSRTATVVDSIVAKGVDAILAHIAALRREAGVGLMERTWRVHETSSTHSTKLMQFNMLAEGLSARPSDTPPFAAVKQAESGGFTNVPQDVLDYSKRRFFVLEKIFEVCPDVLALEECDHFHDFFLPALRLVGYNGIFTEKCPSPCEQFGYHPDGVALFYKENVFSLKQSSLINSSDGLSCVHVVAKLEHLPSSAQFVFGATHLKAKCLVQNEAIRLSQLKVLLGAVEEMAAGIENVKVVVLGDFNAAECVEHGVDPQAVPYVSGHSLGLVSAYAAAPPPYTTCKIRGTKTTCHTIDYIWHAGCTVRSVQVVPPLESLDQSVLLPCLAHPSDHFDLAVILGF